VVVGRVVLMVGLVASGVVGSEVRHHGTDTTLVDVVCMYSII